MVTTYLTNNVADNLHGSFFICNFAANYRLNKYVRS